MKYVVYSHFHWDHASGGSVYADTARFIGHEDMLKNAAMPAANTPLPHNARAQDTNGNGQIEQAEARGQMQTLFNLYDANNASLPVYNTYAINANALTVANAFVISPTGIPTANAIADNIVHMAAQYGLDACGELGNRAVALTRFLAHDQHVDTSRADQDVVR